MSLYDKGHCFVNLSYLEFLDFYFLSWNSNMHTEDYVNDIVPTNAAFMK